MKTSRKKLWTHFPGSAPGPLTTVIDYHFIFKLVVNKESVVNYPPPLPIYLHFKYKIYREMAGVRRWAVSVLQIALVVISIVQGTFLSQT